MEQSLYILECTCGFNCYRPVKLSKVGVAVNVAQRLQAHKNSNAVPVFLYKEFNAGALSFKKQTALKIESIVTEKFSKDRAHQNTREWFKVPPLTLETYILKVLGGEVASKGGQIAGSVKEVEDALRAFDDTNEGLFQNWMNKEPVPESFQKTVYFMSKIGFMKSPIYKPVERRQPV